MMNKLIPKRKMPPVVKEVLLLGSLIGCGGVTGFLLGITDLNILSSLKHFVPMLFFPYDVIYAIFAVISIILLGISIMQLRIIQRTSTTQEEKEKRLILGGCLLVYPFILSGFPLLMLLFQDKIYQMKGIVIQDIDAVEIMLLCLGGLNLIWVFVWFYYGRVHNEVFPKRKLDFWTLTYKKLVKTLDEGENWMMLKAQNAAFQSFFWLIPCGFIAFAIHGIVTENFSITPYLILLSFTVVPVFIYTRTAKKMMRLSESKEDEQ